MTDNTKYWKSRRANKTREVCKVIGAGLAFAIAVLIVFTLGVSVGIAIAA